MKKNSLKLLKLVPILPVSHRLNFGHKSQVIHLMSLKLLQVEYAKTVHEGSAAEGIYCKDIVVLISQQSGGAKECFEGRRVQL